MAVFDELADLRELTPDIKDPQMKTPVEDALGAQPHHVERGPHFRRHQYRQPGPRLRRRRR